MLQWQSSKLKAGNKLRSKLQFLRCVGDDGAVLILISLILPFLFGLTLLVVDGGRLFNLDTSLQNNVDALALAAASELDRRPNSHVRACRAMKNTISTHSFFLNNNEPLTIDCDSNGESTATSQVEWSWLKSIPPDHCDINAPGISGECFFELSTNPSDTFFIVVKAKMSAAQFSMLFPASLVGSEGSFGLPRFAIAGMSRVVCQPTPLMVCNPWESSGYDTVPELRLKIGSLITAREYGGGAAPIGAGEFGLLDPNNVQNSCDSSGGSVVSALTQQMAGASEPICGVRNGVCPKTGVVASLDNAVNTRFDMYDGSIGSYVTANPSAYAPAARSIWSAGNRYAIGCQKPFVRDTDVGVSGVWYPRETNWDRVAYFSQYVSAHPELASASSVIQLPDGASKSVGSLTRYESYLWEVNQASLRVSDPRYYAKRNSDTCYANKVSGGLSILNSLSGDQRKRRRNIYAAIMNCSELQSAIAAGASYKLNGASTVTPIPSLAIAKFFITEPMNRTTISLGTNGQFRQSSTDGSAPSSWPSTCPLPVGYYSFYVDLGTTLSAGRTYYIKRPNATPPLPALEATLGSSPTIIDLAAQFTASASALAVPYKFCTKVGSNFLFIATSESSNQNDFELAINVFEGNKRLVMELVDVYSADNGSDVSRDIVRLYR